MSTPAGARLVEDPAELAEMYADVRAAHIYALADLEEPFWSGSRWYRRGDAVVGVVALPDGEGLAVYAVSTLDPAGCLALLVDVAPSLSAGLLITGPTGLADALRTVRGANDLGPHLRFSLTDPGAVPTVADVELLGHDHLAELGELYATEPGAAFFLPHMLADETFVGRRVDGRLVAAAGTHVASTHHDVAAIGAVYTHPDHRGRGHGAAVTAAVARRLIGRVGTIGLNVHADNTPARHIYESMGFTPILAYDEAELH